MAMSPATLTPKPKPYRGALAFGTASPNPALFYSGDANLAYFRNAGAIQTQAGTLLTYAAGQTAIDDPYSFYIVTRRLTPSSGGYSLGTPKVLVTESDPTNYGVGGPTAVQTASGRIFLFYSRFYRPLAVFTACNQTFLTYSDDDGLTWSAPSDIAGSIVWTPSTRLAGGIASLSDNGSGHIRVTTSAPHGLDVVVTSYKIRIAGNHASSNGDWTVSVIDATKFDLVSPTSTYSASSATGTWKSIPAYFFPVGGRGVRQASGRLSIPWAWLDRPGDPAAWCSTLYSDDAGATWTMGGRLDEATVISGGHYPLEVAIEETTANALYFAARDRNDGGTLLTWASSDGGTTLGALSVNSSLPASSTKPGLCKLGGGKMAVGVPVTGRTHYKIYPGTISGGSVTWGTPREIDAGGAGYSSLFPMGNGKGGFVVEMGNPPTQSDARDYMTETNFGTFSYADLVNASPPTIDWQGAIPKPAVAVDYPSAFPSNAIIDRSRFAFLFDIWPGAVARCYADQLLSRPLPSPWYAGQPVRSMYELGPDSLKLENYLCELQGDPVYGTYRGYFGVDTGAGGVGGYLNLDLLDGAGDATSVMHALATSGVDTTNFNWMLAQGASRVFTIGGFVKATLGSVVYVFDITASTTKDDGVAVFIGNSFQRRVDLFMKAATNVEYSDAGNTTTPLTADAWGMFLIRCNGVGASKVEFFNIPLSATITDPIAATYRATPATTMANHAAGTTADDLYLFGKTAARLSGKVTGMFVHKDYWTDAQIVAWFNWKKVSLGGF